MKPLKNIVKYLTLFTLILVAILYITDTDYLLKAVKTIYMKGHSTAYLSDYQQFDNQTIEASNTTVSWPNHKNYNSVKATETLSALHESTGSVAFVIITKATLSK